MVRKPHVKSLRLSDATVDCIERAEGYTFTEKFENFVHHAVQEEPELDRRLESKRAELEAKRAECRRMCEKLDMSDEIFHSVFAVVNELEDLRSQLDRLAGKTSADGS